MAAKAGASPDSIEVKIEIDNMLNKIRAIAIGTTDLRTKDLGSAKKTNKELQAIVADNLHTNFDNVFLEVDNSSMCAYSSKLIIKSHIFFKKEFKPVRLIDRDGVIRLQRKNAEVYHCRAEKWRNKISQILQENTAFGDGGEEIPNIFIVSGSRIIDLTSMQRDKQIFALCEVELMGLRPDEILIMVCTKTSENERG
jgi:hypothetical protein